MISRQDELFAELKSIIAREKNFLNSISSLENASRNPRNKEVASSRMSSFIESLNKENDKFVKTLEKINLFKALPEGEMGDINKKEFSPREMHIKEIKKEIEEESEEREKKKHKSRERIPSPYVVMANRIFANFALSLERKGYFSALKKDLGKANMNLLLKSYVSVIFFTALLSVGFAVFFEIFLLFFKLSFTLPFVSRVSESILLRFVKTSWIIIIIPIITYIFMYFYPLLEKKSLEKRMAIELPFVAINMAAISNSMVDPTKIFSVIISTKEYPLIEDEFIKIINAVNVLGYNLVAVLRERSRNVANNKLADLFNGLATTINSGGDLAKFFDERAKALLFDYNLEKEKSIRVAETFMDIYISVVIAAPMILMLLLVIIQISGIGVSLDISVITLIIVFVVSIINVIFILFLRLKQT